MCFFMFGVKDEIKTERQHEHRTSLNMALNMSSITMVVKPESIWKLFTTKPVKCLDNEKYLLAFAVHNILRDFSEQ